MDSFFKINYYPIIYLLSLFSLQSPLLLSWFSHKHGFLHETWFLHVFSSLLINSPANSAFCLCGTIFNAMETSWVGGLGLPLLYLLRAASEIQKHAANRRPAGRWFASQSRQSHRPRGTSTAGNDFLNFLRSCQSTFFIKKERVLLQH